ncbi:nucleotide-diphospho-sugar transferase [Gongronella butleri]|nr:nucleotide-diphospho-sugar transferase [Gongronella butleri]
MLVANKKNLVKGMAFACALACFSLLVYFLMSPDKRVSMPSMRNYQQRRYQNKLKGTQKDYSNIVSYSYEQKPLTHPNPNLKAALVYFVKGDPGSMANLRRSIQNLNDVFRREFNYPIIVFTHSDLTDEYKELVAGTAGKNIHFEKVDEIFYGYPPQIDRNRAAFARQQMKAIIHGSSEEFRFEARWWSGTISRHPMIRDLDYYWRIEPEHSYPCPVKFDPFQYMKDNNKLYSFALTSHEIQQTIPTYWETTKEFLKQQKDAIIQPGTPGSIWHFGTNATTMHWNTCHMWTYMQIVSTKYMQDKRYQDWFDHVEKSGGIFYERWGDHVIQTFGAAMTMLRDKVHFWDKICYRVPDYATHCTNTTELAKIGTCNPSRNYDYGSGSCLWQWDLAGNH